MAVTLFAVVVTMTLASCVMSYPTFQQQIPNGDRVPNPCNPTTTWMGVGHQNLMGGGVLNPFGNDFRANSFTWNATVCQKDSDGDGLSNGYELGDPNCTWSAGQTPSRNMNLTHPGVCEPLGSMNCVGKNSWITNCNNTKFDCPAIRDPGVKNYSMRFPVTSVPTDETTYICNRFLYPNDSIADIIAIEPVVDNMEIIHHMLLYGCVENPVDVPDNGPYLCGMGGGMTCTSLIGIWGFGATGQCLNSQMGFRIGPGALQYAVLQIHWNNPQHKANLTDSSGMRIYYTNQLRKNRGEIMMVGQNYLEIPPGKETVTFYGNCSSLCTKSLLKQSLYITSSTLHMHMLGNSGSIRLYRNGALLMVLEEVKNYDYNTPTLLEFEVPIEFKAGDSIEVKCVYSSIGKNTTTWWGEATSDEMCYAFFAYYPQIPGFPTCGQWKTINYCSSSQYTSSDLCDLPTFLKYTSMLPTVCSGSCSSSSCVGAMNAALATGCQRYDDVRSFLQGYLPNPGSILAYCALDLPTSGVCPSTVTTSGDCTTPRSNQIPTVASRCSTPRGIYSSYSGLMLALFVFIRRFF